MLNGECSREIIQSIKSLMAAPGVMPERREVLTQTMMVVAALAGKKQTPHGRLGLPSGHEVYKLAEAWIAYNFQCSSGYKSRGLKGAQYLTKIMELHFVNKVKRDRLFRDANEYYGFGGTAVQTAIIVFMETNKRNSLVPELVGTTYSFVEVLTFVEQCLDLFGKKFMGRN